jgi:TolA-binding protein
MSAPDIHPENLLDKFTNGGLTLSENSLLQEHLAGCAACRFELIVRSDLEAEAEALDFDRVSTRQLLLELPEASHSLPLSPEAPLMPAAPVPSLRRVHRRRAIAITAAALALASGAAALVATQTPSAPETLTSVVRSNTNVVRVAQKPRAARPPSAAASEPAPTPPQSRSAGAAPKRSVPNPPASDLSKAEDDVALSAAELFSNANQARRASDPARATRLYRLLQRKFPGSEEAQLSWVTLGSLQLNGGNPAGALSTFNRYLSRGGRSLEAEALYGQAQALRQLGRSGEERNAWERLLARYPGSGYAPQARERLNSLGGS